MKLMQNGLFIDEIWAKIAVGTLSYRWNLILAIESQIESNMAVGSLYYRWNSIMVVGSTRAWSGPSNHVAWRKGNITKKSAIYLRYITDISPIYHRYFATRGDFFKISPIYLPEPIYRRYIADILAIFTEISPLRFFFTKYRVDPSRYTIYRRYIADISRHFPPWLKVTYWHHPT